MERFRLRRGCVIVFKRPICDRWLLSGDHWPAVAMGASPERAGQTVLDFWGKLIAGFDLSMNRAN